MAIKQISNSLNRLVRPLVSAIAFVAGVGLIFMMLLTAIDVILRFLNRPISGAYELIEYAMALTVGFSVTVAAHTRTHITVDILTQKLKKNAEKVLAALATLIAAIYAFPCFWQSTLQIKEMHASGMTSAVLRIAVYPFTAVVAISLLFTTIVLLADVFNLLAERKR